MKISIAIHIIGLVMWLGGMMIVTRLMKLLTKEGGSSEVAQLSKKLLHGFIMPGLLLSLGSGVYQISEMGMAYYMKQGWFHTKLTLVIILFVVTVLLARQIALAVKGNILRAGTITALHAISSTILILIVFLTILGR